MKRINCLILICVMLLTLSSCSSSSSGDLNIYNVGEYIDMDLVSEFEELYNVKVNYYQDAIRII